MGEYPCRIPEDGINGMTLKCITSATDPAETILPYINNYYAWYWMGIFKYVVVKVKDKEDTPNYYYFY